jgi:alpha-amylase/alpha-mannosidase (GH57 family)
MANVCFLWHLHQPYYVDPATREAVMPWVRLHGVKGYLDMISVIEDFPGVRLNFNLSPVLLLQIKELAEGKIRDRWLEAARIPAADLAVSDRFTLLQNGFKLHWDHLVKPFPRYWELLHKRGLTFYPDDVRRGLRYFSTQELLDLQVWSNLAWCGYAAERLYPELGALKRQGRHFTEEQKHRVLDIHLEIVASLIGKYRAAEERGQVELTTTPFFHPILPLIYDTSFAARSLPGRQWPKRFAWPEDAAAQLTLAVEQHAGLFGRAPRGLWPSEGSIAPELIPLMAESGIQYFASDEENLFNTLRADPAWQGRGADHLELFQGWRVARDGTAVNAIFREKPLSDFIGFMAAKNDPGAAAAHLLFHLRHIASLVPKDTGVIPLILDGENAWEHFADGGEGFLRALYGGIAADAGALHSCTIEDYLRHHPPRKELGTLHTGSWIGSNFDIWIGDPEENAAWDLLGEARAFLQKKMDAGALTPAQEADAWKALYAAEGSDWFWWYGPDFTTDNDVLFDELFRAHLRAVYTACDAVPPMALDRAIGGPRVALLYTTPERQLAPALDGGGSFFDWIGAGTYTPGGEQTTMHRADRVVSRIHFGNDADTLFLRVDFARAARGELVASFAAPTAQTLPLGPIPAAARTATFALPLAALGMAAESPVAFQIKVLRDGLERECHPESAPIQFTLLGADYALRHWIV